MKSLALIAERAKEYAQNYDMSLRVIRDARELLSKERASRSSRWIIELSSDKPFIIIGDLHGDYETLKRILSKISYERLSKGELYLVFLGDYVDRGEYQLETLLTALMLKLEFPESVYLLRGNHEPPEALKPYPHDYPSILRARFGYVKGLTIYDASMNLFNELPLVAIAKREFVMLHGGLPTETFKKDVSLIEYFMGKEVEGSLSIMTEILWNDPVESNYVRAPSPRGAGYLFGRVVTEWFLKKFRLNAVFRGHEAVDRGYKLNHNGRVVTLFSRLGPPYYNTRASYAVIDTSIERWWSRITSFIVTIRL